jgi:hypothetical protein
VGRHRMRQRKRLLFSGLGLCLVAALTLVLANHSGGSRLKVVTGSRPTAPTSPGAPSASPLGKTGVLALPLDATSVSFLSPVQGWAAGFAPVTAGGQVPSNIEVAHTSDGGLSWFGRRHCRHSAGKGSPAEDRLRRRPSRLDLGTGHLRNTRWGADLEVRQRARSCCQSHSARQHGLGHSSIVAVQPTAARPCLSRGRAQGPGSLRRPSLLVWGLDQPGS